MKKTFFALIGLLFLSSTIFAQSRKSYFSGLNYNYLKTGILYNLAEPHSQIDKLTGENNSPTVKAGEWKQVYLELEEGSVKSPMQDVLDIVKKSNLYLRKKTYAIAVINYDYEKLSADAEKNGIVKKSGDKLLQVADKNPFEEHHVFTATTLVKRTYTKTPNFLFPSDLYFSNNKRHIAFYKVDFGDGKGFVKVYPDKKIQVKYKSNGYKNITVKANFDDGTIELAKFKLNVKDAGMPTPDYYFPTFKADIPYNGEYGEADVAVFLGNGNTTLTNPVVIIDGFDPGDTRPIEGLYEIANQQNMVDSLRALGMDGILINEHDGAGYIQKNAMIVVKVLDSINQVMTAAGTMKEANQTVVIGPSMGGLITRYAIRYMELNGMQHNVRNWISFDSPQKGANVPLGLQHWVRFFADEAGSEAAQEAKAALNSNAARQMLIYHFTATDYSNELAHHTGDFDNFYNEINSMGFPQQPRIVAIIDGSGYGQTEPFAPGEQVIRYHYRSWKVDLDGNVWAVTDHTSKRIFEGLYNPIGWTNESENVYVSNTRPLDNAPGAWINTFEEMGNIDPGYGDIIAYYPNHCFIPTISSLCLENTDDPLYNVDAHRNELVTPFDKIYYPHENHLHVEITPEHYRWFKHEIYNYPPKFTTTPPTTVDEDSPYSYTFAAIDSNEWNILTYQVVQKPDWLTYDPNTHTLSGTPTNEDVGVHHVTIMVTDSLKNTYQNFDITVNNVNDAPQLAGSLSNQETEAEYLFMYNFDKNLFTDVDQGDSIAYSATLNDGSQLPDWLSFNPDIRTFSGIPDISDTGIYTVKVIATDLSGAESYTTFELAVLYRPPVFQSQPVDSALEDSEYTYTFDVTNPLDDTLQISVSNDASWLNYNENTRTFSGTPANEDVGTYNISITATNQYHSATQEFTLRVINTNDAPVAQYQPEDTTIYTGNLYVYSIPADLFEDVDEGDELTYSVKVNNGTLPAWLTFENATIAGMPQVGDDGQYTITIIATDLSNASDSTSYLLTVLDTTSTTDIQGFNRNIKIYPNPFVDVLNIQNVNSEELSIVLTDASGKKLLNITSEAKYLMFDLSYLAKGVYILQIDDGTKIQVKKLIKK